MRVPTWEVRKGLQQEVSGSWSRRLDAGRQVLQGEGKSSTVEDYVAVGEVLMDEDSSWE